VREKPHHAPCKQASRGNLTYYAPPFGGGEGGGDSWGKEQGQLGKRARPAGVSVRPLLSYHHE